MNADDLIAKMAHLAPGLAGAMTALLFLREPWQRRCAYVVAGAAASHYGTPVVSTWLGGVEHGVVGYLIGLFAMAVVSKAYEMLQALRPQDVVDRLLARWLP